MSIRWCLVGYQKQENPDILVPLVLLAESHLDCVGFRVIRDITVYDRVAVDAQVKLKLFIMFSFDVFQMFNTFYLIDICMGCCTLN